jgi:hypothetical protein
MRFGRDRLFFHRIVNSLPASFSSLHTALYNHTERKLRGFPQTIKLHFCGCKKEEDRAGLRNFWHAFPWTRNIPKKGFSGP